MNKRGFTLIELLIVIGVLGILAAGMLAAVDPFEQLKKGRDTNRRNVVVEYHNSLIRYYATHGDLPWNDTSAAAACTAISPDGTTTLTTLEPCTDELIDDGELKEDFQSALGNDATKMFVNSPTSVQVRVCFSPESKSLFNDDATKYSVTGDIDSTNCTAAAKEGVSPGTTCFWCAK